MEWLERQPGQLLPQVVLRIGVYEGPLHLLVELKCLSELMLMRLTLKEAAL